MPGSIQVGDRIAGRYDVFEVREGGMGVVFLARDVLASPGREFVAVKTLDWRILGDRMRRGRFEAECRLWTKLGRHPNIVRAHEVIRDEGIPFIVLELIRGGELRDRIEKRAVDLPETIRFGIEFCLGMEHALRQGLKCHRDVKPGNLLLTEDGTLKITDFGVASLRDELFAAGVDDDSPIPLADLSGPKPIVWSDPRDRPAGAAAQTPAPVTAPAPVPIPVPVHRDRAEPPTDEDEVPLVSLDATSDYRPASLMNSPEFVSHLTRTGALLGTLPYMAPEQFRDPRSVDVRADIYSFGIVMHEMITGRRPFNGKTIGRIAREHSLYPPPSVAPSIPRKYARHASEVDEVVGRCLAKNPDDRHADLVALREALLGLRRKIKTR